MFSSSQKSSFGWIIKFSIISFTFLCSPYYSNGPHVIFAEELQSIQFSQVPPYNATLKCNENSSFSPAVFDKIPDLAKAVKYNPETILQLNLTGIWALYYEVDYKDVCVISEVSTCLMQSTDRLPYKSMRYLGNSDADLPGLSLFPGDGGLPHPHGEELYINYNQSEHSLSKPMCVAFWATTGRSNWTVFSSTEFQGSSICLRGLEHQKNGFGSLDYSLVGSIRQGCNETTYSVPNTNDAKSNMKLTSCRAAWSTTTIPSTTGTAPMSLQLNILSILAAFSFATLLRLY